MLVKKEEKMGEELEKGVEKTKETLGKEGEVVKEEAKETMLPTFYQLGLYTRGLIYLIIGFSFMIAAIASTGHGYTLQDLGNFLLETFIGRLFLFLIGLGIVVNIIVDTVYKTRSKKKRIKSLESNPSRL